MKHSSIPSAQTVVLHCKAKGIQNIVISPGSRNAPLIIGFSGDPYFKCFSIVDERSAAFFALGMAQQLKTPVALVCTSGSAVLNYYPAVAEGFYSDIPLVVISADRPAYKIDIGDGQTIHQKYVLEKHVGYSANLRQDVVHSTDRIKKYSQGMISENTPWATQQKVQTHNNKELNIALNMALKERIPVHINIPFEEPLYNQQEDSSIIIDIIDNGEALNSIPELSKFMEIWNGAKRKMVLVGVSHPKRIDNELIAQLTKDPSVIVLTETTSNLHHPDFFPSIDSIIAPIEKSKNKEKIFKHLKPEILLTFGGLIVSKKIKAFLRERRPQYHWHIDPKKALDTFFCLSHHFKTDVNTFLGSFLTGHKVIESNYSSNWNAYRELYIIKRREYLQQIPFSDFWAYHHIIQGIPANYQLQLANSSTVRYAQLFEVDKTLKIFCNRGTSGIDGSTSTAIGASIFGSDPTLFITGDLSFLYDCNALWNKYLRPDFRIVVINNQGGGIFRILPGHEETENFEKYFETVHNLNAKNLCEMHGIGYRSANDAASFQKAYKAFYTKSAKPQLLEVHTPRVLNNNVLIDYFDFISSDIINH